MTYYGCSLPNSEPFYGGDLALIYESLTANFPRESVTLQSKIQSREYRIPGTEFQGSLGFTVHERKRMKQGGRVCKSFLIHAMSYIPNLFSALCQSAFFMA